MDHLEKNSSSWRGRSQSAFECPLYLQWLSISIGKKGLLNLHAHVELALSRWKQCITGNELLATRLMNDDVRAAEHTLGSSATGHYLRYDGDQMATQLAYDTTQPLVSKGTGHEKDDNVTICSWRFDKIRWRLNMLGLLSLSRKHITTQGENLACF